MIGKNATVALDTGINGTVSDRNVLKQYASPIILVANIASQPQTLVSVIILTRAIHGYRAVFNENRCLG